MLARQDWRADRRGRAQDLRLLLTRPMTAQAHALLGLDAIHVLAPDGDGRQSEQTRQVNGRLRPLHEIGLQLVGVAGQPEDLDPARVVAAMPLDVHVAGVVRALPERGGKLGSVISRDLSHDAELRPISRIVQEHRPATGRNDDRPIDEAQVARAHEVIAPCHAVLAIGQPLLAAPAVAVKPDNLFHEVPRPSHCAIGFDRIDVGTERCEVRPVGRGRGRRQNRLAAVDDANDVSRCPVQHVVVAGRRADMQVLSDDRRGRDVVAVPRSAARGDLPQDLERR